MAGSFPEPETDACEGCGKPTDPADRVLALDYTGRIGVRRAVWRCRRCDPPIPWHLWSQFPGERTYSCGRCGTMATRPHGGRCLGRGE